MDCCDALVVLASWTLILAEVVVVIGAWVWDGVRAARRRTGRR